MSNMQPASIVAKLFNRTERRVQQLARDSVIPKPIEGKYNVLNCFIGYVKYLQNKLSEKSNQSGSESERKQLLQLQCEKLALEIKASNREVLPTDQVVSIWSNMLLRFRAKVLAIPYRSAQLLVNLSDPAKIEQIQRDLLNEALTELSKFDPRECDTEKAVDASTNATSATDSDTHDIDEEFEMGV